MHKWKPFTFFEKPVLVTDFAAEAAAHASSAGANQLGGAGAAGAAGARGGGLGGLGSSSQPHKGIRALDITCCTGDGAGGCIFFGDSRGKITVADRNFSLRVSLKGEDGGGLLTDEGGRRRGGLEEEDEG